MKPGLLTRVQEVRAIRTDRAMAGAIGVSEGEYLLVKSGQAVPTIAFLSGVIDAFGLTLAEIAEVDEENKAVA